MEVISEIYAYQADDERQENGHPDRSAYSRLTDVHTLFLAAMAQFTYYKYKLK